MRSAFTDIRSCIVECGTTAEILMDLEAAEHFALNGGKKEFFP